jgi:uncharacterized protein YgbK (DUF1537 family)
MIGVVADDITGANDIGAYFAAAGFETYVYTRDAGEQPDFSADAGRPEVAIVDTDSRFLSREEAYRSVAAATRALVNAGCDRFIKKTCSVFRGNVGAEFDALMDTLREMRGEDFADLMIVVPGYPINYRTTVHRIQYVFDKPLAESHFRNDPVHPMTSSDIVDILQRQTSRAVGHVDADLVREGIVSVREAIAASRKDEPYLLFDVPDQAALRTIAEATKDERVFGGSAGPASELAPLWKPGGVPTTAPRLPVSPGTGILVVAGSLTPITAEQVSRLAAKGATVLELDASAVLEGEGSREVERLTGSAAGEMLAGRDVVITIRREAERVAETAAIAARRGLSEAESGQSLSRALGAAAAQALKDAGQNRLLAAGGDTSAAVCRYLGLRSLRIGHAIEPGIPLCTGFSNPPVRLVLKGGSMGSPGFLVRAVDALRAS